MNISELWSQVIRLLNYITAKFTDGRISTRTGLERFSPFGEGVGIILHPLFKDRGKYIRV